MGLRSICKGLTASSGRWALLLDRLVSLVASVTDLDGKRRTSAGLLYFLDTKRCIDVPAPGEAVWVWMTSVEGFAY